MKNITVSFTINGEAVEVSCAPDKMLVDVIRDNLFLTGTKIGCREGECGACTIIMDGEAVNSCLIPVAKAMGKNIQTIEGVADGDKLHPIQEAFIEKGAVQCGFCTPGIIMSAKALLDKNKTPDKHAVREAIGGNICRCTGYVKIEDAINHAARIMCETIVKGGGK
ncbi:(2Fe-2S)-binding protein [Desulfomonile tiedjei]|uniref:Aerobic-type carbon monoxide dehydrogenase, small subunit CoxS/CutS-like protein n=1 Tax=Desulfomonile tiedjei (strain ATCC 49306 / DSM 6799 / DCB-1) TaxID=706587 RepID=I4C689_DESTA|nr:(2Fe-2S)-binding protein [Desulfomonile tiedjei]AFM25080.1 aerobic-type carbon monoxide dehydrogenase, small subunit CoxS/CutS-like protein [Desulfomonile tiedjei DSM 6799]